MANNRIEYLDLVKFFAICLVCIGHSYAKIPTLESSLCSIIYSFHMPLFMLVCVVCYYIVKLTKQIKLMNTLFYGGLNY